MFCIGISKTLNLFILFYQIRQSYNKIKYYYVFDIHFYIQFIKIISITEKQAKSKCKYSQFNTQSILKILFSFKKKLTRK